MCVERATKDALLKASQNAGECIPRQKQNIEKRFRSSFSLASSLEDFSQSLFPNLTYFTKFSEKKCKSNMHSAFTSWRKESVNLMNRIK